MSWSTKRIKLGACTVGALTAAVLAVSTTPAAASGDYSGRAYIWGSGDVYNYWNDWDDEGELGRSRHASSNVACLWQKILWADGNLESLADVDGVFGDQTYNATRAWQTTEGVKVDGGVGRETFGAAGFWLDKTSGSASPGQTLYLRYFGSDHNFDLRRLPDGNYEFKDGSENWRKAGYNYRSCT
ncbi:peptidoglycan-binding domain-containing protein [Streptomyces sp. NPDC005181]|uniref:peptidoglycan-binding domain-containing protein n=1 Tax=Streptomyces sp. NPDC005181 TaxID=3156869 RepID=UPI0033B84796